MTKPVVRFPEASKLKEGDVVGFTMSSDGRQCRLASSGTPLSFWGKVLRVFGPDQGCRPTFVGSGETWVLCGFRHGDIIVTMVKADTRVAIDEAAPPKFFLSHFVPLIEAAIKSFDDVPSNFKPPWEI